MALGDIIRSFPSVDPTPRGLTFDGKDLWLSADNVNQIWQIDRATGTVIRSLAAPALAPRGLAFDGKDLWHVDATLAIIYQIDLPTGSVIRSFAAPGVFPTGLAFEEKNLWCAQGLNAHQIDRVAGVVIRSFGLTAGFDLTFDGKNLYETSAGAVNIRDLETGAVVNSFAAPLGAAECYGITFDGKDLWISDNINNLIHQVSLS